ncbi:MAG: sugar phosphate nucleotidyltransferase [Segetibacter sp.]
MPLDFGKQILPESIGKYKVASFQYEGYWTDIGNIYSFYEANLALTDALPPFNLFDNTNTVFTTCPYASSGKIYQQHFRKIYSC